MSYPRMYGYGVGVVKVGTVMTVDDAPHATVSLMIELILVAPP